MLGCDSTMDNVSGPRDISLVPSSARSITVLWNPAHQVHGKPSAAVALLVATALAVIPWIMPLTRS